MQPVRRAWTWWARRPAWVVALLAVVTGSVVGSVALLAHHETRPRTGLSFGQVTQNLGKESYLRGKVRGRTSYFSRDGHIAVVLEGEDENDLDSADVLVKGLTPQINNQLFGSPVKPDGHFSPDEIELVHEIRRMCLTFLENVAPDKPDRKAWFEMACQQALSGDGSRVSFVSDGRVITLAGSGGYAFHLNVRPAVPGSDQGAGGE